MSKYPIINSKFESFNLSASDDRLADKGILYTLIQTPDSMLHVFSTHTQAYYNLETDDESRMVRTEQLTHLIDFVVDTVNRSLFLAPIYITGDFNINSMEGQGNMPEEYTLLTNSMVDIANNLGKYADPIEIFAKGQGTTIPYIYDETGKEGCDTMNKSDEYRTNRSALCWKKTTTPLHVDYSFLINPLRDNSPESLIPPVATIIESKIREFKTPDELHFKNLSDHYGLSTTITFSPQENNNTGKSNTSNKSKSRGGFRRKNKKSKNKTQKKR